MALEKKDFHTPKKESHSPLDVHENKKPSTPAKKTKDLAQEKSSTDALNSDHRDNIVFRHGPTNRGK